MTLPSATPPGEGSQGVPMKRTPATRYLNVPYAGLSDAQKLDIYIPPGEGPYPTVVIIHGGGFQTGDKAGSNEKARINLLVRNGYAVASINYRLSDEAIYPAQIQDAKTAVRFLRARAEEYHLDAQRMAAWGSSAGGMLAALLGTTCGVVELEGAQLGHADQSSCVLAVVDWFGLVDLLSMDAQFAGTSCKGGHDDPDSAESRLLGAALQTVPGLAAKTNPLNYVTKDDAAFFIQHGSRDCRVPPVQSEMLAEALVETLGAEKVYYEQIEDIGHGGKAFRTDENYQKVLGFLDRFLKAGP